MIAALNDLSERKGKTRVWNKVYGELFLEQNVKHLLQPFHFVVLSIPDI